MIRCVKVRLKARPSDRAGYGRQQHRQLALRTDEAQALTRQHWDQRQTIDQGGERVVAERRGRVHQVGAEAAPRRQEESARAGNVSARCLKLAGQVVG